MMRPFVIVGGGIAGASLAFAMTRRGRDVVVIDDTRIGRATAWNPGGINPLHGPGFPALTGDIYRQAYALHSEWHPLVCEVSGIEFGARVIDRLFLAETEGEAARLRDLAPHYEALDGFSAQWLDPDALARRDDRLGTGWRAGLITHGNMRIDAERYRQALLAASQHLGMRLIHGRVGRVNAIGENIQSVTVGGEEIAASDVCMATGAWGGEEIAGWEPGNVVLVMPMIGDLLLVRSGRDDAISTDISHGIVAIYQHDHGLYWVGGTERSDGPLGQIDPAARDELLDGAARLFPPSKSWNIVGEGSAARPMTPDGQPVLGRAPAYRNGWIINGGGGKGILMSTWIASMLTEMIVTGEVPEHACLFAPNRAS